MNRLAIIPARSGSKGLKDKNVIDLCGKPLMAYTIEEAIASRVFSRVIVSTDSEKYAEIARNYGADIVMRGEAQSNDKATTYDVLTDLLGRLSETYDTFTLLQPTSPLRNFRHIQEATSLFENHIKDFDFLVSLKPSDHAKILVNPIDETGSLRFFDTDFSCYHRQGYKDYTPNGAIFMAKPSAYLQHKHFFGNRSLAYIMNKYDSVDIDDWMDLELAKVLLQKVTHE